MDVQFVDYDNVRFHLSTPSSKTSVMLSMGIQCWPDLVKYGAREHLQKEYDGLLVGEGETEPEYNVSLVIDLEKLPASEGMPPASIPLGSILTNLCRREDRSHYQTRPPKSHSDVRPLPRCFR